MTLIISSPLPTATYYSLLILMRNYVFDLLHKTPLPKNVRVKED